MARQRHPDVDSKSEAEKIRPRPMSHLIFDTRPEKYALPHDHPRPPLVLNMNISLAIFKKLFICKLR